MNTDTNGCSTCPIGEERYERFATLGRRLGYVQYDYRAADGELFSTVAPSLAEARAARGEWLAAKQ